jgi:NADP-dependent 3-hydroxy acid dehydrogenase YdfG
VKAKYHKIDVLVNNAGVAVKGDAFDSEVVKFTFATVNII